MKHYESYVAEAQARRRQRVASGIAVAVMLAALALWALLSFQAPAPTGKPFAGQGSVAGADSAADSNAARPTPADWRAGRHAATPDAAPRYR